MGSGTQRAPYIQICYGVFLVAVCFEAVFLFFSSFWDAACHLCPVINSGEWGHRRRSFAQKEFTAGRGTESC